jgi:hypothetical protein
MKKSKTIYGSKRIQSKKLEQLWLNLVDQEMQQHAERQQRIQDGQRRRDAWNNRER